MNAREELEKLVPRRKAGEMCPLIALGTGFVDFSECGRDTDPKAVRN